MTIFFEASSVYPMAIFSPNQTPLTSEQSARSTKWFAGVRAALQWNCFVCAFALLALAGCSDGRPARVPVSGQVLIDDKPLSFGVVRFVPESKARVSTGHLDNDGRFTLSCFGGQDGAVVGKHRVEVCATEPIDEDHIRWHAPKRYSTWGTSKLEQEITGPTDSINIQLSWEGGQPFVE